ncbi:cobalt-precorrin-6A reductase [Streptomyces sp. ST2-7A]|uniref:cobalt-precorrin-6A reductase n=1 Tax=Streptomyces sp. ST2-7A TaxID=2907214 RepID=UPI001F21C3E5|nr:cobalt-precorrin-6A reductase [Streptomyces sp. ST2-7A]MCE7080493.1 cobalt-precorrin-6A reductase [Streptomyces sp. ST2-7A]
MTRPGRPGRHVLVLGGTTEGRRLAGELLAAHPTGLRVTTSLAGRVAAPRLPEAGEVRIGGFGGPAGLADWLREHAVDLLIDATHPFAVRVGANAALAAGETGVPLLALRRPGWTPVPGDRWHPVDSLAEAAGLLPTLGSRILLTTGRLGLAAFAHLAEPWFLVRSVDPPTGPCPPRMGVLTARGPFDLDGERALLREYRIDVLVTKDSGGTATAPKLTAAREVGVPVVIVRRPEPPAGVPTVTDPAEAVARVGALLFDTPR